MSNLPPGCTPDDIERNANGSCPECGRILRDGHCRSCNMLSCEECSSIVDHYKTAKHGRMIVCLPCKQMLEDEETERKQNANEQRIGDGQERSQAGDALGERADHAQDDTRGEAKAYTDHRAGTAEAIHRREPAQAESRGPAEVRPLEGDEG